MADAEQMAAIQKAAAAGGGGGGMPNAQQAAEMQAKQKQEQEMREDLLTKMVAPDARERLRNIAIVKPEKAQQLENMIIEMGRKGQLRQQLDDKQLKGMLEQISGSGEDTKPKISFDRRRFDDDDSDIDLDGL